MQFNSESVDCEDGHNIRSNQHNPEENNEVNYKWICELCTYQNWMAAKSCVMCHSKKHHMAQIISENNVNQSPSQGRLVARKLSTPTIAEAATSDIFKLGTSGSPPSSILSCSPPPNNSSSGKINSRSSSPASHYNNIAYYLAQQHLHQSGAAAASSTEGSDIVSDRNEQYLAKWSCAQCTYLNLPKSPKCIQCLYSRSKKVSPSISRNSPVSPRTQTTAGCPTSFGENSSMQNVHGIHNNNNQHISASPYRPQSTSPPPKSLHNLGAAFENSLRINTALEDSMSINERNRNNCSPPHSLIQNSRKAVVGIQEKKAQYHNHNKEKNNALLQNRVKSPPIISSGLTVNTTSPTSSASPPPLSSACTPKKWICQACTYENWPRSKNCVICGNQRVILTFIPEHTSRESPPPEAGTSSSSSSQHNENSTRNVRPSVGQSHIRENNSQISPPMSARGVLRHLNQAEILTSSTATTSSAGSNQVIISIK